MPAPATRLRPLDTALLAAVLAHVQMLEGQHHKGTTDVLHRVLVGLRNEGWGQQIQHGSYAILNFPGAWFVK